jgi:hypothetical protein
VVVYGLPKLVVGLVTKSGVVCSPVLDCTSFESTLNSLESILGLSCQIILETISSFDCAQYSRDHPNDYRNLKEILSELLTERGARPRVPTFTCWFHGTRVLQPDLLRAGIRPLNEQIESIWRDLFRLAQCWVNEHEWNAFRQTVETTDLSESSVRYRHRLSNEADYGPHAVLVRDALVMPDRFWGTNYLQIPETIDDICASFARHFKHDLQAVFQQTSFPCIVKFQDERARPNAISAAMTYIYCITHNETCVGCNTCFEGNGTIAGNQIVNLEVLAR